VKQQGSAKLSRNLHHELKPQQHDQPVNYVQSDTKGVGLGECRNWPLSALIHDCRKSPVSLMMPDRAWVGSRWASDGPILFLNPGLRRAVVA
jgi:hypothetical protein